MQFSRGKNKLMQRWRIFDFPLSRMSNLSVFIVLHMTCLLTMGKTELQARFIHMCVRAIQESLFLPELMNMQSTLPHPQHSNRPKFQPDRSHTLQNFRKREKSEARLLWSLETIPVFSSGLGTLRVRLSNEH